MQRLEVRGAVRPIYGSLGFKRLTNVTYIKLCVGIPEDGINVDRNMYHAHFGTKPPPPPSGPGTPHSRGFSISHDTPQSLGRLWTSDQPVAETSTLQHKTLKKEQTSKPPGRIRTHDLSRQAAADLRLRPRGHWDRQYAYKGSK